jgi:acyl carrier protein
VRSWFSKAENFQSEIWDLFTVLDRLDPPVIERVVVLVRQILAKRGVERTPERDEDLTEVGLSSLDMVNLMLAVETEFDVKIPDRDMTPANFRSIGRIEALLAGLLQDA